MQMQYIKKTILAAVLLLCAGLGQAQDKNWGLGVRLGDPSGLTLKKYMGKNALEISVGRTYLSNRDKYYKNYYNDWSKKKGYNYGYYGYEVSTPIALQIHYLFQKPIASVSGLDWYYGIGGQVKHQKYTYYYYNVGNSGTRGSESATNLDLGLDGVLGLEYTFKEAPISVFTDLVLFMELVDEPFRFLGNGGIGVRYNF